MLNHKLESFKHVQAIEIKHQEKVVIEAFRSFCKYAEYRLLYFKRTVPEKPATKSDALCTSKRSLAPMTTAPHQKSYLNNWTKVKTQQTTECEFNCFAARLGGTELMELEGTGLTEKARRRQNLGKIGRNGDDGKLEGTAETEPLNKEDGTEATEKLAGTAATEPLAKSDGTGMMEKPPLATKVSFKMEDQLKEDPKQKKKM
ncbi:hypothetical protein niasHS_014233 [Heterodera schachtii]|uniref:Uncharacterized protein n=1 Tax=Heterodera schachtii TaxID=97005 RepID=A0ABD2I6P1_HETSC